MPTNLYNYLFESINQGSTVLPVLQKIHNKTLILRNYILSSGACQALKKGLMSDKYQLNQIYIDNCGLSDENLAEILEGVSKLDHV